MAVGSRTYESVAESFLSGLSKEMNVVLSAVIRMIHAASFEILGTRVQIQWWEISAWTQQ